MENSYFSIGTAFHRTCVLGPAEPIMEFLFVGTEPLLETSLIEEIASEWNRLVCEGITIHRSDK